MLYYDVFGGGVGQQPGAFHTKASDEFTNPWNANVRRAPFSGEDDNSYNPSAHRGSWVGYPGPGVTALAGGPQGPAISENQHLALGIGSGSRRLWSNENLRGGMNEVPVPEPSVPGWGLGGSTGHSPGLGSGWGLGYDRGYPPTPLGTFEGGGGGFAQGGFFENPAARTHATDSRGWPRGPQSPEGSRCPPRDRPRSDKGCSVGEGSFRRLSLWRRRGSTRRIPG